MRQGPVLSQSNGFTLIELLITITLISVLVTFGFSAYTKAQNRQRIQNATEILITTLESAHKNATIGNRPADCLGSFRGYQIDIVAGQSQLTETPICSDSNGTAKLTTLTNISFVGDYTFTFKPLTSGIDLGANNSLDLVYLDLNNATNTIHLTGAGNLEYLGVTQ